MHERETARSGASVRVKRVLLVAAACLAAAAPLGAQHEHGPREPWPEAAVEALGGLPLQDGGRVKPLSTFSSFTLLRLSGKRTLSLPGGERIDHERWLLDVLLRPELADHDPLFLVQDDALIAALGIDHEEKRKRDRYAFGELAPALPRLFELAHRYDAVDPKERTSLQEQLVFLAENVNTYLGLRRALDFARAGVRLEDSPRMATLFGGRAHVGFRELVERAPELVALFTELGRDPADADERAAVGLVLRSLEELGRTGDVLALLPPSASAEEAPAWLSAGDVARAALAGERPEPLHLEALACLEGLALGRDDAATFQREAGRLASLLRPAAEARGEYRGVARERAYYAAKLVPRSLACFVAAFLLLAVSWLRPRGRLLSRLGWSACAAGTLLLAGAIVWRCVIRGRPPVSTLYETVLLVTWVGTTLALVMEAIGRRRVALGAGAFLGMVGLFLANGYEVLDKRDTMPSLVAVLDTNFWLATHVTAITIGYSAGMLAALLASVYLLAKLVGWRRVASLGKMVYGVLCFAVIFSLVGTVLGGIWANDSWGRFWGWDPKENGALLIVISQVAILHARMGGTLREHGVCMAAAFGGTVIAFSWWGVNLLGVGLHSYGFTSGIHRALWGYYLLQWAIVGAGAWSAWRTRAVRRGAPRVVRVPSPGAGPGGERREAA